MDKIDLRILESVVIGRHFTCLDERQKIALLRLASNDCSDSCLATVEDSPECAQIESRLLAVFAVTIEAVRREDRTNLSLETGRRFISYAGHAGDPRKSTGQQPAQATSQDLFASSKIHPPPSLRPRKLS